MAADTRPVVLIVDDHAEYVEAMELSLRDDFHVLTATNGLDGYALACERRPDVIVLDIMMPIVSGWTVLQKLKVNPITAGTPIVVASAVSRERVRLEVDPLHVAAIVQKPCDPDQVAAAIRIAVASRGGADADRSSTAKHR